jgi:hypothetical protein
MSKLQALWRRLLARRSATARERDAELQRRSPAERRLVEESVEDRQSDAAAEEWLGGVDSYRYRDDDEPPRD